MSGVTEEETLREALCEAGRRLYAAGLLAGTSGNLSARLTQARVLVTPRGRHKGRLEPEELVRISLANPSSASLEAATTEFRLHRRVYRSMPPVGAVVHAHAPALTALGLRELDPSAELPEAVETVGGVAVLPYSPAGTERLAAGAAAAVAEGAAVLLLRRHGAVAVGPELETAVNRLELAELTAKALLLAR